MDQWGKERVLVTGGTGFIGSHVVQGLLQRGAAVRVLAHYNSGGTLGNLSYLPPHEREAVEVVMGDLRDPDSVHRAINGCTRVLHLGALIAIPYSYQDPRNVIDVNVMGTLNVLMSCRAAGIKRIVHTSTSEVYGTPDTVPIAESHSLKAQSPYSASKIGADKIAESFHCSYGLPVVTVRPFNAYGPRQSMRAVIPTILSQALWAPEIRLGSLWPRRDYTFVTDTAEAFILAAQAPGVEGKVINVGSGSDHTIGELVAQAKAITNREVPVIEDSLRVRPPASEVHRLLADSSKARDLLGWEPKVPLIEGLRQSLDFIKAHFSAERAAKYVV